MRGFRAERAKSARLFTIDSIRSARSRPLNERIRWWNLNWEGRISSWGEMVVHCLPERSISPQFNCVFSAECFLNKPAFCILNRERSWFRAALCKNFNISRFYSNIFRSSVWFLPDLWPWNAEWSLNTEGKFDHIFTSGDMIRMVTMKWLWGHSMTESRTIIVECFLKKPALSILNRERYLDSGSSYAKIPTL
jgi:hypothetical protein